MPIQDEVTITTHDKSIDLFTDRHVERRIFASYLNADIPPEKLIFFHGDGGNGKSLLLKYLRTHYCKYLVTDDWAKVAHYEHDIEGNNKFVHQYKILTSISPPIFKSIPCIYHDFDRVQSGEDSPLEAWSVLISLRTELAKLKFKMPLFDYAVMRYLHHGRGLSKEQIKSKLPMDELGLASDFIDLITSPEIPFAGLIVKVFNIFTKYISKDLALWQAKRKLTEEDLNDLHRLDTKSDLIDVLPKLFSQDLNIAMQLADSPVRLVFMFDSHEAFWGTGRQQESISTYFQRDEWLRRLLNELYKPNHHITVVLAGREPPRWHEASNFPITDEYIDTQLVGQFSRDDADDYLKKALGHQNDLEDIKAEEEKSLRTSLIDYAEIELGQVHPLHLGLSADVVLMARSQGKTINAASFENEFNRTNKSQILIARLLKYCPKDIEEAVIALAAARGFDQALFQNLGDIIRFNTSTATFKTLTSFSFVWGEGSSKHNNDKKWYRIHSLLCHNISEYAEKQVQAAHSALESIYRDRAISTQYLSIVDAIYHANKQDWHRGYQEWVDTIETALNFCDYDLAEALIELQTLLELNTEEARGHIHFWVAKYNSSLSRNQNAVNAYNEAIKAYSEALEQSPDDITRYIDKGNAIYHLAQLYSDLSQTKRLIETCGQALDVYDAWPDNDHRIINNKSTVLMLIAKHQSDSGQFQQAIDTYKQVIRILKTAELLNPNSVRVYSNKGLVLTKLGELYTHLNQSHKTNVLSHYTQAIEAYKSAINLDLGDIAPQVNMAQTLINIGDFYNSFDKPVALKKYLEAIKRIDETLELAPRSILSHVNKGLAFIKLSQLLADLNEISEALTASKLAVQEYMTILSFSPDDIRSNMNLSTAFLYRGRLYRELGQGKKAYAAFQEALKSVNKALTLAPERADIHFNKGNTLCDIAKLYENQENPNFYKQAIKSYKEALRFNSNSIHIHFHIASTLFMLGILYKNVGKKKEAIEAYQQSNNHFDIVLSLNPNEINAKKEKQNVLIQLAKISREE